MGRVVQTLEHTDVDSNHQWLVARVQVYCRVLHCKNWCCTLRYLKNGFCSQYLVMVNTITSTTLTWCTEFRGILLPFWNMNQTDSLHTVK